MRSRSNLFGHSSGGYALSGLAAVCASWLVMVSPLSPPAVALKQFDVVRSAVLDPAVLGRAGGLEVEAFAMTRLGRCDTPDLGADRLGWRPLVG